MRIDMKIILHPHEFEGLHWDGTIGGKGTITLTVEQARALRDQITKHLRGANRDKEQVKP